MGGACRFGLAELAPGAGDARGVLRLGQFSRLGIFQQVVQHIGSRNVPGAYRPVLMRRPRLDNRDTKGVPVMIMQLLRGPKAVAGALRVLLCLNRYPLAMLVIDHMQYPVMDADEI